MYEALIERAFDLLLGRMAQAKKAKEEQGGLVQQVQAACDTRAVFTAVDAQIDLDSMFAALVATRRHLQGLKSRFTDAQQQQRVADLIGELDEIERAREDLDQNWVERSQRIDEAKTRIIQLVRGLSEAVDLPYALPSKLTHVLFQEVEQAAAQASRDQEQ